MLRRLGYDSVIRFSPAFYNTKEEIEVIGDRMEKIISFLKKW
jgi:cysteine desulfurase/selenocysteine lyase